MKLETLDISIFIAYVLGLLILALWISREEKGANKNTEDYFLACKALPWWAIGASLIASNISAEQIIGQSGQGFAVGIAIAAYEWQAAIVLLVVAKWFLPIFLMMWPNCVRNGRLRPIKRWGAADFRARISDLMKKNQILRI